MAMKKVTSIRELEQSAIGGVHCINITPADQRQQLVFTVGQINGDGLDNVFIPATGYPIDLTAQVTKQQLMMSSAFRRAIAQGLIQLITQEYYDELMGEEGALEEVTKAMREMTSVTEQDVRAARTDNRESKVEVIEVHPQVEIAISQLRDGAVGERDTLVKLKGLGELNKTSYQFISKQTKEFPMIAGWVQRIREEMFAE